MSSFTTPLRLEALDDGRRFRVIEPFRYFPGELHEGEPIVVPAGFETDFASVPRGLWNLFPPWGRYGKAAVVHDYLYKQQLGTRAAADRIFREAMAVLDVPAWKRWLMWSGVRAFGWIAWRHHKGEEERCTAADSPDP